MDDDEDTDCRVPKQTTWSQQRRKDGLCTSCGDEADTNPKSRKPYSLCPPCRKNQTARMAARYSAGLVYRKVSHEDR